MMENQLVISQSIVVHPQDLKQLQANLTKIVSFWKRALLPGALYYKVKLAYIKRIEYFRIRCLLLTTKWQSLAERWLSLPNQVKVRTVLAVTLHSRPQSVRIF